MEVHDIELAEPLRLAVLRLSRQLRREASKVGLSAQDALLLAQINKQPGIGVSELAELEGTSRPTMSVHMSRLEAAGLVSRAADANDARRTGFTITAQAKKLMTQLRKERTDWMARRLAQLSSAEQAQLAAAIPVLMTLIEMEP